MHMATLRSPLFRNQYACLDLFWAKKNFLLPPTCAAQLLRQTMNCLRSTEAIRGNVQHNLGRMHSITHAHQHTKHQNIDWLDESFNCNTFEESLIFFSKLRRI